MTKRKCWLTFTFFILPLLTSIYGQQQATLLNEAGPDRNPDGTWHVVSYSDKGLIVSYRATRIADGTFFDRNMTLTAKQDLSTGYPTQYWVVSVTFVNPENSQPTSSTTNTAAGPANETSTNSPSESESSNTPGAAPSSEKSVTVNLETVFNGYTKTTEFHNQQHAESMRWLEQKGLNSVKAINDSLPEFQAGCNRESAQILEDIKHDINAYASSHHVVILDLTPGVSYGYPKISAEQAASQNLNDISNDILNQLKLTPPSHYSFF